MQLDRQPVFRKKYYGEVMTTLRSSTEETRLTILKLCRRDYLSPREIALRLGKPVNTVRAHYIYPMVRDGLLVSKDPTQITHKRGYKSAR